MNPEQKQEAVVSGIKSIPAAGTAIASNVMEAGELRDPVFGLKLSEWSIILMMMLVLLQFAHGVWKFRRDVRREEERLASRQFPPDEDTQ